MSDDWRDWRAEAKGLTWRCALPQDMFAMERLWKAKGRVVGNDDRPDLFAWPVVLTLVAEDDQGFIVDGVFLEAVVDVTKIGCSPEGFESLVGIAPELAGFVASRKMRFVYAILPTRLDRVMGKLLKLAGFEDRGKMQSVWAKRI
jgi:hypothetical protein